MKSNYPQQFWQLWRKTDFLRTFWFWTFWFWQVFSQSYGHLSLCSIHVIKSTHPFFEHTKYEPDMSNHARKKWRVKIAPVFRTPCRLVHFSPWEKTHFSSWLDILKMGFPAGCRISIPCFLVTRREQSMHTKNTLSLYDREMPVAGTSNNSIRWLRSCDCHLKFGIGKLCKRHPSFAKPTELKIIFASVIARCLFLLFLGAE